MRHVAASLNEGALSPHKEIDSGKVIYRTGYDFFLALIFDFSQDRFDCWSGLPRVVHSRKPGDMDRRIKTKAT